MSEWTYHKFQKIISFCTKKYRRPHLKTPSPFVRKMYALELPNRERLLWTAPNLVNLHKTMLF